MEWCPKFAFLGDSNDSTVARTLELHTQKHSQTHVIAYKLCNSPSLKRSAHVLAHDMHEPSSYIYQQRKTRSLQQSASATCSKAHGHGAKLIHSAPDAQLAVVVSAPAQEAAAARHSACVIIPHGDAGDGDACRGRRGGEATFTRSRKRIENWSSNFIAIFLALGAVSFKRGHVLGPQLGGGQVPVPMFARVS
jgi:hypothetical protein